MIVIVIFIRPAGPRHFAGQICLRHTQRSGRTHANASGITSGDGSEPAGWEAVRGTAGQVAGSLPPSLSLCGAMGSSCGVFVGGGVLTLAVAIGFYFMHTRVTEEEEWYADYFLALGLCVFMYGTVAVAVSQEKPPPVATKPSGDVTVNPMADDDDSDGSAAAAAEAPAVAQVEPAGIPGPFALAIGLFVGAFIAAMIGVNTNEWQKGQVSLASGTYEDFDSFEAFARAVLPGAPGGFRLRVPSGGVTANQTISVPDLQRLKIEGVEQDAFGSMQNSASLELAPLYGGNGQAFRVLGGGRLDLLYLTIANRTETAGCGAAFGVPCCDTDLAVCPTDRQLGGAAVFVASGGLLTATRVLFRDLHVAGDGGAIISYGVVQVRQSWFFDCTANRWGGALAPLEGAVDARLAGMTNLVEDSMFTRCASESGACVRARARACVCRTFPILLILSYITDQSRGAQEAQSTLACRTSGWLARTSWITGLSAALRRMRRTSATATGSGRRAATRTHAAISFLQLSSSSATMASGSLAVRDVTAGVAAQLFPLIA